MVVKRVNPRLVRAVAERRLSHVRIYSYQDPAILTSLQSRGYINGDHGHSMYDEPYAWMREQMAQRIPDFSGDRPIWAWLRRYNARHHRASGEEPVVRITAIVPTARILVSHFGNWHIPLNDGYFWLSEAELADVEARYPHHRDIPKPLLHASWTRVLDLDLPDNRASCWQLCVDRIYAHEMVQIRPCDTGPVKSVPDVP